MFDDIRNPSGERLDATYHPGAEDSADVVVIGHGVTANKDRPFLVALAEGLAEAGIAALRFSFAGNGASQGEFVDAVPSKEVDDLGAVLDQLEGRRIAYAGHSMGGAVGVMRASKDPRIAALVSLAGMVDTAGFAQRKFGHQVPGESFMWDKPDCPLSPQYMADMEQVGTVAELGREISIPWLLVHGTADEVVPPSDAADIREHAPHARLVLLEGADHVFSGPATAAMVATVVGWLRQIWHR